ncbi:ABC transporter permease [endosymbiont of Riftia pachyptila]|uniref:ABC3 transporter permease C-terminal domain-containing protein n=1 Tax=endosymbiont of Riftia pachyptila (vent Ph05) TaxID=1048808 RepID=G2DBZ3_9GAMM|nr:ABC transporter permease [endosymbiont of Riftia pachyptila]EGV51882.1 hypothetical protein Rifp1Sym_aw00300 [endosymbiont of Riftia pachyptila (vent Ph05)]
MNPVLQRKLRRDLWQRKWQLLTLFSIIAIGVGAYIGMAGTWRDMDGARHAYYRDYHLSDFLIDLKRAPEWAVTDAAHLPGMIRLEGRISLPVLLDLPGTNQPITGQAISLPDQREPAFNQLLLRSGSRLSDPDRAEVILNHAFAAAHGLKPGDRIRALLLESQQDLLVVGTAQSPEFVYLISPSGGLAPDPKNFGVIYLGESFLRQRSDLQGAYNQVLGRLADPRPAAVKNSLQALAERLDPFGVSLTTPLSEQASFRFLQDELTGLEVQSRIMPMIFLSVAALVLHVLIGRLVNQQRTLIGTLRALGYARSTLIRHYLAYGLAVGTIGGLLGIMLGIWLQSAMVAIYRGFYELPGLVAHHYWDLSLIGLAISLLFAALGSLSGVRRATQLQPAEAMRPPAPQRGGHILLESVHPLWRRLNFRWRSILRSVFRNPFRSFVSLLASLIATALIFATFSMIDALDHLMGYEFEQLSHQDLTISLRDPVALAATREIVSLPGISLIEPELLVSCDLVNGPRQKRIAITGLSPDARLHTPLDSQGRRVAIPPRGLILGRKLAEILRLAPGDRVELRPLIGRRIPTEATVAAVVESYLGLAAYADITYLSRLLGEQPLANQLLAKSAGAGIGERLQHQLQQRPAYLGASERRQVLAQLDATFGETMGSMIFVMVLFAGMIAFGSVLNTAMVSLNERQQEIGTLRVIGYSSLQVSGLFFGESLLLNTLGMALGLYGGVLLSHGLSLLYSTELYRFPAIILPGTLLISALLMLLFLLLAQGLVYLIIRRLNWLESLKVKE